MKKNMNTDFSIKDVNKEVTLYGWVARKRDLGGLVFIDLRDKSGIIQLCVKPDNKFQLLGSDLNCCPYLLSSSPPDPVQSG